MAPTGSNPFPFADPGGSVRLFWDEAVTSFWAMHLSQESDLFMASSTDGREWSQPGRLPVSSSRLDMQPILQRGRRGAHRLAWISSRDADDRKALWTASSRECERWSFPRKIALPLSGQEVAGWRESHTPCLAFTDDGRGGYFIARQGRLFRSDDAIDWSETEELAAGVSPASPLRYSLSLDRLGRLLLLGTPQKQALAIGLWRREAKQKWKSLGLLAKDQAFFGAATRTRDELIPCAFAMNSGIFVVAHAPGRGWSRPILIESHLTKPFHPAIAAVGSGEYVVAYACNEGIVATLCRPSFEW